ncbi:MAG TPA: FtsX-like permease family protein [Vicinamibacterales bacterium]|jgi:lipoprotein-releasing system permease protein
MPFEWMVAIRYLREGRTQSLLILAGVAVGVGVIVFLSALISGLQVSLIERTLGTQAHIVLRRADEMPRALLARDGTTGVTAYTERPAQRLRSILQWQQMLETIGAVPGVSARTPTVTGSAFARQGTANRAILVRGIDPGGFQRIIDVRSRLTTGRFDVSGTDAVIGTELANALGLTVGDKLRLSAADDRTEVYTVRGIFDIGNKDANERWVFVSLRSAQTLLDLVGGVSTIEVKVAEIFTAEDIAGQLTARTGLEADSWMKTNTQLLVGLRSQSSSSYMIQTFVIIAVALGIASVLVVSVVQKSREIGILKAMGTPTRRIIRVFLIEGAVVGLAGSILGVALGAGLAIFFAGLVTNPDGSPTFPVDLTLALFLRASAVATVTGIVAAAAPAHRAARLDPVQVIRYG